MLQYTVLYLVIAIIAALHKVIEQKRSFTMAVFLVFTMLVVSWVSLINPLLP